MALPLDGSFDAYNVERLRTADTLLVGRRSYEGFKSFWPSVADDDSASPDNREISRRNNMIGPVVVGEGTPAFTAPPPVALRTIEVRKLEGSENILVRYEVRPKDA